MALSDGERLANAYELELKAKHLRQFADILDRGLNVPATPATAAFLARQYAADAAAEAERIYDAVPVPPVGDGPCQVIEIDGRPVRVQNRGRLISATDQDALRQFDRLLRDMAAEQQDPPG